MSVSPLPTELILSLLDCIYYGDRGCASAFVDRASVSTCALVCRSWAPYAQSLLFRHVEIKTPKAIAAFLNAIQPPTHREANDQASKRVELANAVKVLEMDVIRNLENFIAVTSQLPNVQELILRTALARPISEDDLKALRATPSNLLFPSYSNPLQVLRITAKGRNVPTPIFQLLSLYPSLQLLDIRGTLDFTPRACPNTLQPPFSLSELQCNLPFWNEEAADAFFTHLLTSTSPGSLRILGLHDLPSDTAILESIIKMHGPYLRSLRFAFNPSEREQKAAMAAAIRGCPNLEELQLQFNPDAFILEAIPATVEHLSFRNDDRTLFDPEWKHSIRDVIDAVEDYMVWPRLRVITYVAAKQWDNPERMVLDRLCDDRGIELRCTRKSLGSYPGENEVGLLPARFPRHIPRNTSCRETHKTLPALF